MALYSIVLDVLPTNLKRVNLRNFKRVKCACTRFLHMQLNEFTHKTGDWGILFFLATGHSAGLVFRAFLSRNFDVGPLSSCSSGI